MGTGRDAAHAPAGRGPILTHSPFPSLAVSQCGPGCPSAGVGRESPITQCWDLCMKGLCSAPVSSCSVPRLGQQATCPVASFPQQNDDDPTPSAVSLISGAEEGVLQTYGRSSILTQAAGPDALHPPTQEATVLQKRGSRTGLGARLVWLPPFIACESLH